jgi:hypothetical protein
MRWKTGWDMSKCARGGLHQPPSSEGWPKLGGQKLVAVTTVDPGRQAWGAPASVPAGSQRTSKQAPQLRPLLNSAVLSAAVLEP